MELQNAFTICLVMFMLLGFVLMYFVGIKSPYGKLANSKFGPLISARLAWVVMESPAFAIPFYFTISNWDRFMALPISNKICMNLFMIHYFNRALIYPFLINNPRPVPLSVPFFAMCFCILNGVSQGLQLLRYPTTDVDSPQFLLGLVLFAMGMYLNIDSDRILRNLRPPGSSEYKIPRGGMFEYVSQANFFGEIVEWTGFALMCGNIVAAMFVVNTCLNVVPRALQTHQWYVQKFDNYPQSRKAVFPYVL